MVGESGKEERTRGGEEERKEEMRQKTSKEE